MSTRCQVQVVEGINGEKVTLYHHYDGYPGYIIPVIAQAYEIGLNTYKRAPVPEAIAKAYYGYYLSRAGKVASFLCAADPGIFEPEDHHDLHGDIEYYYKIWLVDDGGNVTPTWDIQVFVPVEGFYKVAKPTIKDLKPLTDREPLAKMVEKLTDQDGGDWTRVEVLRNLKPAGAVFRKAKAEAVKV